jgi:hypothetical protein
MSKKNLKLKFAELSNFMVDGVHYIGKVEKTDTIKVSDAIEVKHSSFERNVREWIKADNIENLQTLEFDCSITNLVKRPWTEDQKLTIAIEVAKAERAIKNAIPNLQNQAIDDLS